MTSAAPTVSGETLSGLLTDFLRRCPGAEVAVLTSEDGIRVAHAGCTKDEADRLAAGIIGMVGCAKAVGDAMVGILAQRGHDPGPGRLRQHLIDDDRYSLFSMAAGPSALAQMGAAPRRVDTVLAVGTRAEADPGVTGHEMKKLITSLARHLTVEVRTGEPASPDTGR